MTSTMMPEQGVSGTLAPAEFRGSPCVADPDLFFTETHEAETAAKAICASCPFRGPCLSWALVSRLPHGVAGGLTEAERRLLRRRESRQGNRPCSRCGGEVAPGFIYCGGACRDAARADSRAMADEIRAARRRGLDRRRRAALHTVAAAS